MRQKEFLILCNRYCMRGIKRDLDRTLVQSFSASRVVMFGSLEEAIKAVESAAGRGAEGYIAVGGDGTVNMVLNAMAKAGEVGKVLGVIPAGTDGSFAKNLGLPEFMPLWKSYRKDPRGCERELAAYFDRYHDDANLREADAGFVSMPRKETRYFVDMADFGGLACFVERACTPTYRRLFGKQRYIVSAVLNMFSAKRRCRAVIEEIVINGETHVADPSGIVAVTLINNRISAGITFNPHGSIFDGALDLLLFRDMSDVRLARLIVGMGLGGLNHVGHRFVDYYFNGSHTMAEETTRIHPLPDGVKRMTVRSRRAMPIQIDGEIEHVSEYEAGVADFKITAVANC